MLNTAPQAAETMTMDTLFAKYHKRAILHVLLGDFRGTQLLHVARLVWDTFPAFFPEIASIVLESEDLRAAAWDIGAVMADVPGAWDVCVAARDIAHA